MDIFLQQLINGLVLGSVYAMVALGYTMVYGILELINFAHGEITMMGAMVALSVIGALALATPGLPGVTVASCTASGAAHHGDRRVDHPAERRHADLGQAVHSFSRHPAAGAAHSLRRVDHRCADRHPAPVRVHHAAADPGGAEDPARPRHARHRAIAPGGEPDGRGRQPRNRRYLRDRLGTGGGGRRHGQCLLRPGALLHGLPARSLWVARCWAACCWA